MAFYGVFTDPLGTEYIEEIQSAKEDSQASSAIMQMLVKNYPEVIYFEASFPEHEDFEVDVAMITTWSQGTFVDVALTRWYEYDEETIARTAHRRPDAIVTVLTTL